MREGRLKTHSLAVYQPMDRTVLKIRHHQSCGPFSSACPSTSVLFSFFLLQRLQAMFPFRILGDVQQLRQHLEPGRNYGFLCWFNFLSYMEALHYHVTSLQVVHMNPPKSCLLCICRLFGLPQMLNIKEDEVEKKNKMRATRLDLNWFGLHCKHQLKDVTTSHQNITLA